MHFMQIIQIMQTYKTMQIMQNMQNMQVMQIMQGYKIMHFMQSMHVCRKAEQTLLLLSSFAPLGPEGQGGCFDSPSLGPLDSLPTRSDQGGALDPKEEGRSGRLAEKALYCALEENAHRFFRAPAARCSDFVCAPSGRACVRPGQVEGKIQSKFALPPLTRHPRACTCLALRERCRRRRRRGELSGTPGLNPTATTRPLPTLSGRRSLYRPRHRPAQ